MAHIYGVPTMVIEEVWPEVEPFVQKWLESSSEYRWEAVDVYDLLRTGDLQLWLCLDEKSLQAIMISELRRTRLSLDCEVFMAAGEMPVHWHEWLKQLEDWAKRQGCTHMSAMMRPGFAKLTGYQKAQVRTFKEL